MSRSFSRYRKATTIGRYAESVWCPPRSNFSTSDCIFYTSLFPAGPRYFSFADSKYFSKFIYGIMKLWSPYAAFVKSSIFWDITSCSPLKVNRRFGGRCRLLATCFHASYLLYLFFDPEDGSDIFLRNVGWIFIGLHDVISQKTELFITTAVRTSNPT
jgi:hypothetical protein